MENRKGKKLALIRVLQILQRYSDDRHPIGQAEIVRLLREEYGIEMERKAVSRNVALLREAGFDVISGHRGCWMGQKALADCPDLLSAERPGREERGKKQKGP